MPGYRNQIRRRGGFRPLARNFRGGRRLPAPRYRPRAPYRPRRFAPYRPTRPRIVYVVRNGGNGQRGRGGRRNNNRGGNKENTGHRKEEKKEDKKETAEKKAEAEIQKAEKAENSEKSKFLSKTKAIMSMPNIDTAKLLRDNITSAVSANSISTVAVNNTLNANLESHTVIHATSQNAVKAFEMSLIRPGTLDAPFFDSTKLVPVPHGVLNSRTINGVMNNNPTDYLIVMTAPVLAPLVSANLAFARGGIGIQTFYTGANIITFNDICGGGGTFAATWGGTTAAQRIFTWSMRVQVVLNIPEAVVQGSVFIGSAPASLILGTTVNDLIQMSTEIRAEKGGQVYEMSASIVDRALVHQPYNAYTPALYPQDERVSWLIFSPNSAGTISGVAPATYTYQVLAHANYVWVPIFQPEVAVATKVQVEDESKLYFTAAQKSEIDNVSSHTSNQVMTMQPGDTGSVSRSMDGSSTMAEYFLKHMKTHPSASTGMSSGGLLDFLSDIPAYDSMLADVDYYLNNASIRWGDWSTLPDAIQSAIEQWFAASEDLLEALQNANAITAAIMNDFNKGTLKVLTKKGCKRLVRTSLSGRTIDDWLKEYDTILDHLGEEDPQYPEDFDDQHSLDDKASAKSTSKSPPPTASILDTSSNTKLFKKQK